MTYSLRNEPDASDMARLQGGDHAALDDLMDRHAAKLVNYLARLLQNESDAADIAQDTFVRVFQHGQRFDPQKSFSTWLYTIATNLARDRMRWRSRRPDTPLSQTGEEDDSVQEARIAAPDASPDRTLLRQERAVAVQRAVADLPEDLRTPLILSVYEDQSHAEVAAILNCTPKAVETRLYRARQQLRVSLGSLLETA